MEGNTEYIKKKSKKKKGGDQEKTGLVDTTPYSPASPPSNLTGSPQRTNGEENTSSHENDHSGKNDEYENAEDSNGEGVLGKRRRVSTPNDEEEMMEVPKKRWEELQNSIADEVRRQLNSAPWPRRYSGSPTPLSSSTQILSMDDIPYLNSTTAKGIIAYEELAIKYLASNRGGKVNRIQFKPGVKNILEAQWSQDPEWGDKGDWFDETVISEPQFIAWLKKTFISTAGHTASREEAFIQEISSHKIKVNPSNVRVYQEYAFGQLKTIYDDLSCTRTDQWEKTVSEAVWANIRMETGYDLATWKTLVLGGKAKPTKFLDMINKINEFNLKTEKAFQLVTQLRVQPDGKGGEGRDSSTIIPKVKNNKIPPKTPTAAANNANADKDAERVVKGSEKACWTCGHGHSGECKFKDKSWSNHDSSKHWAISEAGLKWKAQGWLACPPREDAGRYDPKKTKGGKGENTSHTTSILCTTCAKIEKYTIPTSGVNALIPCIVKCTQEGEEAVSRFLLDTGALDKSYISSSFATTLLRHGCVQENSNCIVASGLSDSCQKCKGSMSLIIKFTDELKKERSINLDCLMIDSPFQIIIGREAIRKNSLGCYLPSHFLDENSAAAMLAHQVVVDAALEAARGVSVGGGSWSRENDPDVETHTPLLTMLGGNTPITSAFEREDIDEIDEDYLEAIPTDIVYNTVEGIEGQSDLPGEEAYNGPAPLQRNLKELVMEYKHRFRSTVTKDAAKVTPYHLTIDELLWEIPANRGRTRRMDSIRQKEMKKQIDMFVEAGIIRPSRASHYSHAFLTPKRNDKWRFVVDYKNLNSVSKKEAWPIPNIKQMLERIGEKRPKYFIVLDLTSGYFQTEIKEECRVHTAFLSPWGLYEWCRLPMGLSGAPSYFQRILSTEVLGGLFIIIISKI